MRHTCDTTRAGSERSENTCAACHEEMSRSRYPTGHGDVLGDWQQQTTHIVRKPDTRKDYQP